MKAKTARRRQSQGLPWYRNHDGWWYATIRGVRYKLAKGDESKPENNREEARREWIRLMALADVETGGDTSYVWALCEKYLDYIQETHPACYPTHRCYCQQFKDAFPELRIRDLKANHIEAWFAAHPEWADSTKRTAAAIILAALNHAANPKRRYIAANPLKGLTLPAAHSRGAEAVIDPDLYQRIYDAAWPWLQDVLLFLRQTGTRPVNLTRITAASIDAPNRCARIEEHKTRGKTGKPLVIPLTESALALLLRLAEKYPDGPLFRGRFGQPLTGHRIAKSFIRIKDKLGLKKEALLYGIRHTFATELFGVIEDGELAFALGHKDVAMLYRHYGHMETKGKAIAEKLNRLVGEKDSKKG